jgi:hypothetical protein
VATYVPAKRGAEFIFYVTLRQQADQKLLKSKPTIASGDFTISKDGGAFASLATTPTVTPSSGYAVKITLSASEMTADQVIVVAHDASGAEWIDDSWSIQTTARQIDDLLAPTTTGRTLDVTSTGCAGVDLANVEGQSTTLSLSGTTVAAVSGAVGSVTGAVASVTGDVGGDVLGSVDSVVDPVSIAAGGIPVGAFATGAITADAIATDAIGAAELAAGAIGADEFAQAAADKAWASASRTLTSVVGLKKNTARPAFPILMRSATDHITPVEGLTVQARRMIDGGAWADCANSVVEIGSGVYVIDLAPADTNGDNMMFKFSAAGPDTSWVAVATST